MDYNERNGSYSDDELLSRFSRPETPRTTVQDDIPDDPAAFRQDRGPRPGIRMASGRPMRGMKKQRPTGRKGSPNYRAALCGAVLAFFVIALLFFVLFMSRGGKIVSASVCLSWLITSPSTAPLFGAPFPARVISSKSGSSSSFPVSGTGAGRCDTDAAYTPSAGASSPANIRGVSGTETPGPDTGSGLSVARLSVGSCGRPAAVLAASPAAGAGAGFSAVGRAAVGSGL